MARRRLEWSDVLRHIILVVVTASDTCVQESGNGYLDALGHGCAAWDASSCTANHVGYTAAELRDVRLHCPACCHVPLVTNTSELRRYLDLARVAGRPVSLKLAAGARLALDGEPLLVSSGMDVTLSSESGEAATLDAARRSRVVEMHGGQLLLSRVNLIRGTSTGLGGCAYANTSSTIHIYGSTISNCTANGGGGLYAWDASVSLLGTTISDSTAALAGGGLYAAACSVSIGDSTFSRCRAESETQIVYGGAIAANGGNTSLIDSRIESCSVSSPARSLGGGISLAGDGNMSIINTAIINTFALIPGGGITTSSGGSVVLVSGTLAMSSSSVADSTANRGGAFLLVGGSASIISSSIANSSATSGCGNVDAYGCGLGGAFFVGTAKLLLFNSTIADATAAASGGGLLVQAANMTRVDISQSQILNTVATGTETAPTGGAIAIPPNTGNGVISISQTIVSGARAGHSRDVVVVGAHGGCIYVGDGQLLVTESNFTECGTFGIQPAGGAFYISNGVVNIEFSSIVNAACVGRAPPPSPGDPEIPRAYGGGIYVDGGTFNLSSSTIFNAIATFDSWYETTDSSGGGVSVSGTRTWTVPCSRNVPPSSADTRGHADFLQRGRGCALLCAASELQCLAWGRFVYVA